jgi:hypothetical protein
MSDDFLQDPEESQQKELNVDRAYAAAGPREFNGQRIEAWSGRRRAATFEIGFTGQGSTLDPIRVLYCCAIAPDDVSSIFRNSIIAVEKFLKWAESNDCLSPTDKNYSAAFAIAEQILDEVSKSEFTDIGDAPSSRSALEGN